MMTSNSSSGRLLRIVFDTNIYIAALLRPGMSEELLEQAFDGHFTLITSEHILSELHGKLIEKSDFFPEKSVSEFLQLISGYVLFANPSTVAPVIKRDPDDDHILACAKEGNANCIVTLDKDLLDIKSWEGIAIIHPKTFSFIL